jgi:hypothetical protein
MARSETTKPSPGHDAAIDQLGCGRSEGIRAQRTQRTKERSMKGRIYAVASSEDSIDSAAKLGAPIVMFADRP